VADLRAAGLDVDTLDPLVNTTIDIRPGLPVLLDWLERAQDSSVRQMIVRALTDRRVRGSAAPALVRAFRRPLPPDEAEHAEYWGYSSYLWTVGNALSVVADDSVFEDIVELAADRRYGRAREMLLVALGNMRDPRAVPVLVGLLTDPDVAGHAVVGLRKLKPPEARDALVPFLDDERAWVRREARKAITAIDAWQSSSGTT